MKYKKALAVLAEKKEEEKKIAEENKEEEKKIAVLANETKIAKAELDSLVENGILRKMANTDTSE